MGVEKRMIVVHITNPGEKKARKIAKFLIERKLVGCCVLFPVKSIYWWNGEVQEETEWIIWAKTLESKYKDIQKEVAKIHPYEVPCILKIKASSNEKYFNWLKGLLNVSRDQS